MTEPKEMTLAGTVYVQVVRGNTNQGGLIPLEWVPKPEQTKAENDE